MAMSRNFSSNEPNPYGSDDAFDTYIDMDFLRSNAMEEDVDFGNMSSSDLFRYYLGGEFKDTEVLDQPPPPPTYPAPIQTVTNDFSLVTSPVSVAEDLKLTSVPVIEETNEISQQTIATTAVGPSIAIIQAQLSELLAKLPAIKQETTSDKISSPTSPKSNATQTAKSINQVHNNVQKGEDNNQIDMKKLSSKERRQIRNKISARNFRVRRKEYIQNLETTKEQQQEEINLLRQALLHLQEENTKLQQEVEELRKQKQQNTKPIVTSPPSPPHISSSSATTSKDSNNLVLSLSEITNKNISRPNVNQIKGTLPSAPPHQPSSPASRYIIPNVNKDTSPSPSSANQKTWQDPRVRVQTTFIPEFNLDKHLFKDKSTFSYLDFHTYPYRYSSMINLIEFSQSIDGQKFWLVYMLISTAMQQMTNLFIEAVCSTPKNQMISALFPNINTERANEIHFQSFNEEKKSDDSFQSLEIEQLNSEIEVQENPLLDSNTMVETVKEASVLDWLYDAMVKHVVEQSQMEAKMAELSDWVGEEWDDNVLPFLF